MDKKSIRNDWDKLHIDDLLSLKDGNGNEFLELGLPLMFPALRGKARLESNRQGIVSLGPYRIKDVYSTGGISSKPVPLLRKSTSVPLASFRGPDKFISSM